MFINNKKQHQYWDNLWDKNKKNKTYDIKNFKTSNYVFRRQHEYLNELIKKLEIKNPKLLEIGCADSIWLPYFALNYGFEVDGLDYSEIGCQNAREQLMKKGIKGNIVCADLFNPPENMVEKYDVVFSYGVVEHFDNTEHVIKSLHKYVKPTGMVITIIPNMSGLIGFLTKFLNKPIYDIHNPLTKKDLNRAAIDAGVSVKECEYFLSNNFGVLNLNGLKKNKSYLIKQKLLSLLCRLSFLTFRFEKTFINLPTSKYFSPYIHCITKNKYLNNER